MESQTNLHQASHMRALAHPTRLRLLSLLRELGPQTAAHLAEHVNAAPGSLSYHLRTLASADLIKEAPDLGSDGRQRWWRASSDITSWDTAASARDPERLGAQRDLYKLLGQAYAQRLSDYIDSADRLPDDWLRAGFTTDRVLRLTATQLAELRDEIQALEDRWLSVSEANEDQTAANVFFLAQGYKQP